MAEDYKLANCNATPLATVWSIISNFYFGSSKLHPESTNMYTGDRLAPQFRYVYTIKSPFFILCMLNKFAERKEKVRGDVKR